MRGPQASPVSIGLAMAILVTVLLVAYGTVYWWRLPYILGVELKDTDSYYFRFEFTNAWETAVFRPAVLVHTRLHEQSFEQRTGYVAGHFGN